MRTLVFVFLLTIIVTTNCTFAADKPGPEDYAVYVAAIRYIATSYGGSDSLQCVILDRTTDPKGEHSFSEKSLVKILDSGYSMSHGLRRAAQMPAPSRPVRWDSTISELYGVAVSHQLIESFVKGHAISVSLNNHFEGLSEVKLLSTAEDSALWHSVGLNEYWRVFGSKSNHFLGRLELSRVGYSDSKNLALVYIDFTAGATTGQEALYILEKRGGNWEVERAEVIGKY